MWLEKNDFKTKKSWIPAITLNVWNIGYIVVPMGLTAVRQIIKVQNFKTYIPFYFVCTFTQVQYM